MLVMLGTSTQPLIMFCTEVDYYHGR
jgi:hypothetical protein